ncbi:hypothetical protein NDN08_004580 [Rhodosorus marinus]|uniref:C2H2-type domain-containing protein n=1 Tax=Rhodosorus marinus TaxID=101924 RepID=A0AAV8UQV9_9RHOD|nr:hypothetical protein NDN08_004580 [Rhodosorus marinus]
MLSASKVTKRVFTRKAKVVVVEAALKSADLKVRSEVNRRVERFIGGGGRMFKSVDSMMAGSRPLNKMDIQHLCCGSDEEPEVCRKTHKCRVCGKRFEKSNTMRDHMRIHTNEKAYKCNIEGCGKAFKWRSSLSQHRRLHFAKQRDERGRDMD